MPVRFQLGLRWQPLGLPALSPTAELPDAMRHQNNRKFGRLVKTVEHRRFTGVRILRFVICKFGHALRPLLLPLALQWQFFLMISSRLRFLAIWPYLSAQ